MKFEIHIDDQPAALEFDAARLRFQRSAEGSPAIDAPYSAEHLGDGRYSLLIDGRSYSVALLSNGEVSVNGRVYRVDVIDPRALRSRGQAGQTEGRQVIAAPMPGRVIRVLVEPGQFVESGQGLIVVEAMKMQNEMKSPKSGTVTEVRTSAGAAVAAGDALLVIE